MKTAVIHSFKGSKGLRYEETPAPEPKENEVQVAIHFAGMNPVDWKIADGLLSERTDYEFPITLGWDMAGVVSKLGSKGLPFAIGDPVFAYCYKGRLHEGTYAQFITLDANQVVRKPRNLSLAEASVIPLSCLTAWQALFDIAHLSAGQTVLIPAGAGGVGSFAIQLAKHMQAHVITTASAANHAYVRSLGADEVIDYRKQPFEELIAKMHPKGIDFVFDTVGQETLKKSYQLLKRGGWIVTIAGLLEEELLKKFQVQGQWLFVQPSHAQLTMIARLLEQKELVPPPVKIVPFEEIAQAMEESRKGHTVGKMTVQIPPI